MHHDVRIADGGGEEAGSEVRGEADRGTVFMLTAGLQEDNSSSEEEGGARMRVRREVRFCQRGSRSLGDVKCV